MTPTQLKNLKASGGLGAIAVEHIEYQQRVMDKASRCMKEMQERIDKQQKVTNNHIAYIKELKELVYGIVVK